MVTPQQNFDSLLFDKDHPGRSVTDTYYLNKEHMLRTHTSAHQSEILKKGEREFLVAADVYRRDEIDASHYPAFHQLEGVKVFPKQLSKDLKAEAISLDLQNALNNMVYNLFDRKELEVRWVDAYFPFTHPSWEMEIFFNNKWLEICGCGIIQQEILDSAGLTGETGWAFGLGLERLAMALFRIPDIRLFWSTDPRFTQQFSHGKICHFKPFSKHPPCTKDISFWLPETGMHANDFFEVVRDIGADLIEDVTLVLQAP